MSQFNKTSERLDKVEKAQAEPAAKLARLSEAVDKLRADTCGCPGARRCRACGGQGSHRFDRARGGSFRSRAQGSAGLVQGEVARLPTIDGWVLRDIGHGGALIKAGGEGMYEVYAGDSIPGLGRIDAVRKQDGRWVVVTSKGLIVAR